MFAPPYSPQVSVARELECIKLPSHPAVIEGRTNCVFACARAKEWPGSFLAKKTAAQASL